MKKIAFPVRYFMSALTPKGMFVGRKSLKWWQMIIIFVFISALMMIPIPLFYAQQKTFNFDAFIPNVNQLMARSELKKAATSFEFKDDHLQESEQKILYQSKDSLIGINLSKKQLGSVKNAVSLTSKNFILQEKSTQFVSQYHSEGNVNPQKKIAKFLQNSWYQSNRGAIAMLMLVAVGLVVIGSNLLLIFGAAFLLSLMKRNPQVSVDSFKEALNMTLNASLYGALIAMVTGLVRFDITLMFTLFSVALALSILAIYWRTRFSDQFTNQVKELKS